MSDIAGQVSWVVECSVKDGQLDAFKELMEEMVAGTSGEPGTLNYEWFISDDGKTVHIYEKYADSAATVTTLKSLGWSMDRWEQWLVELLALFLDPLRAPRWRRKESGPWRT